MATGSGAAWELSGILEPIGNLKSKAIVLGGLANFCAFTTDPADVGYSHGRLPGAFMTCANIRQLQDQFNGQDVNGVSVDQYIALDPSRQGLTPLPSLELSLGTSENSCDGPPCSYSRNLSWDEAGPRWPLIDPGAAFDRIVGLPPDQPPPEQLARLRALDQSVIDYVVDSANALSPRLGTADRAKVDEFLTSVRSVEQRVAQVTVGDVCQVGERPTMQAAYPTNFNEPGGYDKSTHADLMSDLIVMALQCDATRVVTQMMENERSEFVYDHINLRTFTGNTSVEKNEPAGNYHGASAGYPEDFATITRWQVLKVAELCQRLDAIEDGPGVTVLDNSVVFLGSCMEGPSHRGINLPIVLLGGLAGTLKTDQHLIFPDDRPLRDLYFTLMNQGFNLGITQFGNDALERPLSVLEEILA